MLPPTAITSLDSDGFWQATRPPGTSPLLVFLNSKSGDSQVTTASALPVSLVLMLLFTCITCVNILVSSLESRYQQCYMEAIDRLWA